MQIDWHKEWEKHAHGFRDGLSYVCFKELGLQHEGTVVLAPGAGFGDLSHPTTRLVLAMMIAHVARKKVLDVGCGSGILSVAAARMGAKAVYGIDIDDEAILHASHNAVLNDVSSICRFGKAESRFACDILLMNMIRTEQKAAYASLPAASQKFEIAFTSGILAEERDLYLKQTASWGWVCQQIHQQDGWLGFVFTLSNKAIRTESSRFI